MYDLSRTKKPKILVVGDVMLDTYFSGSTNRVSPEAPVPILNLKKVVSLPGGAANVANNIKTLGADVLLMGIIGKDEGGKRLKDLLVKRKVKFKLWEVDEYSTTEKARYLSQNQQLLRVDTEEKIVEIPKEFTEYLNENIVKFDVIVFSDYDKGVLSDCSSFINLCKINKKLSIVDPKIANWERYRGADIIKPNISEFKVSASLKNLETSLGERTISTLMRKAFSIKNILLTKSDEGIAWYSSGFALNLKASGKDEEVYDVTGAGDTVIAVVSVFFNSINNLKDLLTLANIAAGISVKKIGVYAVKLKELNESFYVNKYRVKNSSRDNEKRTLIKNSNKQKIVFTNGCFDLLHKGHLEFLKKCSTLGNILIVGLNDDNSIKSIKGKDRPIISQSDRKHALLSLKFVDDVIIFKEATPINLIKRIKPDVLVKGSDYSIDDIVGADFVRSYGGDVKTLKVLEGYSTSKIINRIKKH